MWVMRAAISGGGGGWERPLSPYTGNRPPQPAATAAESVLCRSIQATGRLSPRRDGWKRSLSPYTGNRPPQPAARRLGAFSVALYRQQAASAHGAPDCDADLPLKPLPCRSGYHRKTSHISLSLPPCRRRRRRRLSPLYSQLITSRSRSEVSRQAGASSLRESRTSRTSFSQLVARGQHGSRGRSSAASSRK